MGTQLQSAERRWSAERAGFKISIFAKQLKNIANLASGPRGTDSTRREAFDTPNESSVAALGASLVTKQAGRVPQHGFHM